MRIEPGPDATQCLLLMLAAVQREPALIRRGKQRSWAQEPEGLLRFCTVTALAHAHTPIEETAVEILAAD